MADITYFAIDTAYWKWVEAECPFPKYSTARKNWLRENRFPYDGATWSRSAWPRKSNTGKTIMGWDVTFQSDDGRTVGDAGPVNRRNDPERNWGLGRE